MAKRKRPADQSLFDNLDAPESKQSGKDAAIRSALLGGSNGGGIDHVALHEAAQSRYLNYALSVITSRALPDVRDGLKPVQRRILYTMWQQNLTADAKHYRDKVIPAMTALREKGDELENVVPHEIWPLATYREMLFIK